MKRSSAAILALTAATLLCGLATATAQTASCPTGLKACGPFTCAPARATCCPDGHACEKGSCYGRWCLVGAPSDAQKCEVEGGQPAIDACTRAIASRRFAGRDLALLSYFRATKLIDTGDLDRAIADFNSAIHLNGDVIAASADAFDLRMSQLRAFTGRALAYLRKGDDQHAMADIDKALTAEPGFVDALAVRAAVFEKTGACDRAAADYGEIIRLRPASAAGGYLGRARCYAKLGQRDRAIADYRAALAMSLPDNVAAEVRAALTQLGAAP
jgi:tetratricopeptide (TPR) repeat protein